LCRISASVSAANRRARPGASSFARFAFACRQAGIAASSRRAEARVVAQGRQIISSEAKVLSRDGKVLAHGTSTIMVLGAGK
jgi:hypothetical protein